MTIPALEVLGRLREGNRRFASDPEKFSGTISRADRSALVRDQEPMAIVLGCSDSRVPVEIVFDHGVGDLFVLRVAGNIVTQPLLGTVEFAADLFGPRLVVVMGHSQCGAVMGTLRELQEPSGTISPNIRSIVDILRPPLEPLLQNESAPDSEAFLEQAVRANVLASTERLRNGSEVLRRLIRDEGLLVVGAEYSLETGLVDFFDGVPGED